MIDKGCYLIICNEAPKYRKILFNFCLCGGVYRYNVFFLVLFKNVEG